MAGGSGAPRKLWRSRRKSKLSQSEGHGMSTSGGINPVAVIKRLHNDGHELDVLLGVMNNYYAVARYGSKTVVASINGNDVDFMNDQDFHKMFSNVTVSIEIKESDGSTRKRPVKLSKYWFDWDGRRQFLG